MFKHDPMIKKMSCLWTFIYWWNINERSIHFQLENIFFRFLWYIRKHVLFFLWWLQKIILISCSLGKNSCAHHLYLLHYIDITQPQFLTQNITDYSVCNTCHPHPSIYFTPPSQPNCMGLLCLPGSCFSLTSAACYAECEGRSCISVIIYSLITHLSNWFCFYDILQIVESFTAHYVFALGVARFLSCAHWVLQVKYLYVWVCVFCCS